MSRSFRLTKRAEQSLIEIARWTIDSFGERQAEIYESELVARCEAIGEGRVHARSVAALVPDEPEAERLFYTRAGEHFIVWLEPENDASSDMHVIIIDFLHGRSDLPSRLAMT